MSVGRSNPVRAVSGSGQPRSSVEGLSQSCSAVVCVVPTLSRKLPPSGETLSEIEADRLQPVESESENDDIENVLAAGSPSEFLRRRTALRDGVLPGGPRGFEIIPSNASPSTIWSRAGG